MTYMFYSSTHDHIYGSAWPLCMNIIWIWVDDGFGTVSNSNPILIWIENGIDLNVYIEFVNTLFAD